MEAGKLVDMANRIGDFFASMPDRGAALEGIAHHLRRYWDPRMRTRLLAHIDAQRGEGLDPIVLEALRTHRALLEPARHDAGTPATQR